jgi:hypothetical protein
MIQIMNDVAWEIHYAYPDIEIKPVTLHEHTETSKTWLLNSLIRLTADIRIVTEEHGIVADR